MHTVRIVATPQQTDRNVRALHASAISGPAIKCVFYFRITFPPVSLLQKYSLPVSYHHIRCQRGLRSRPGSVLPCIDWIMERVATYRRLLTHFTDMDYADDVALLAHAVDDLHIPLWTFF